MSHFYFTDKGNIRKNNEDAVKIVSSQGILIVVADGMGGQNAGEVASKMAIDVVFKELESKIDEGISKEELIAAYDKANKTVYRQALSDEELSGMGTTLTTAYINGKNIFVAHIGDSRAYLYSKKGLKMITMDHSLVNEMVKQGIISERQAKKSPVKNVITRAVGTGIKIETDIYEAEWNDGDVLLLCSDGLTRHIENKEIEHFICKYKSLRRCVSEMAKLALKRGGEDNITIAAVKNDQGEQE